MKDCMGQVTTTTNGTVKVNTEEIEQAKKNRKTKKQACTTRN